MTTDKQKVLGLDSVEQIKTYVCFACENTKREVKSVMDKEHDEVINELKTYTDDEISKRSALINENGEISNYTIKTDESLNPNATWELNKTGKGQLSNNHISWEVDGSGYIGKKEEVTNFDGLPEAKMDKTIYWDNDGIIKFGKDVRPWDDDIKAIYDIIDQLINTNVAKYIILDDNTTFLNAYMIKK